MKGIHNIMDTTEKKCIGNNYLFYKDILGMRNIQKTIILKEQRECFYTQDTPEQQNT